MDGSRRGKPKGGRGKAKQSKPKPRSFFVPEPVKKRPAPVSASVSPVAKKKVVKPKQKKEKRTFFIPEPKPVPVAPPNDQPIFTKDVPQTLDRDYAVYKRPWGADAYTGRVLDEREINERDKRIQEQQEKDRNVKWFDCVGCGKFAFPAPDTMCYWCRRERGLILDPDEPPF